MKYKKASNFHLKKKYESAIQLYDELLEKNPDRALATQIRVERSNAYYHLGLEAFKKKDWLFASHLFFLANSNSADKYLDECYFELAQKNFENNVDKTLEYYNYVTSYLLNSEFTPEILYHRINIYFEMDKEELAFHDYHTLWSLFPKHKLTKKIQPKIDKFLPKYINIAVNFKNSKKYGQALQLLSKLEQYPTKQNKTILAEISDIYLLKADEAFENKEYEKVRFFCDSILVYTPEKQPFVENKLQTNCQNLIALGDKLIDNYKFKIAKDEYRKCFLMIPEYKNADDAILNADEFQKNYKLGITFKQKGIEFEDKKEFQKALNYYTKANEHFPTKEVKHKIFLMKNVINSAKNPKLFAQNIIVNYKNGTLSDRIILLFEESKIEYGNKLVSSSGWKVAFAVGEYNYEVRYDIIAPQKSYYFAWKVNVKTMEITPANKISDKLMSEI